MVEPGGEGADLACRGYFAHRAVAVVGDVEVSRGVEGQGIGALNLKGKVVTAPAGVILVTVLK